MKIIELNGTDRRLFSLVAHLAMSDTVLKYNQGYPIKTSQDYRWFIATDEGNTIGFIPVKLEKGKAVINNYYVADDDSEVYSALLEQAVKILSPEFEVESVTQTQHIRFFEHSGFSAVTFWKRYVKMKIGRDEQ